MQTSSKRQHDNQKAKRRRGASEQVAHQEVEAAHREDER
jgi:hypothetical protein